MSINDDEEIDDEEVICRNISRLTFKFITRIIQQVCRIDRRKNRFNDVLFRIILRNRS